MIVEGSLKTNALIALVVPLVVLAVPFLDTGFVVAKRIKYRRPVYQGDANHFHHRFHRIGFSQRRTVLYLYAWTTMMRDRGGAALRALLREQRPLDLGWAAVMAGAARCSALGASVYLVYVLEILKLRRVRAWQMRRADPDTPSTRSSAARARPRDGRVPGAALTRSVDNGTGDRLRPLVKTRARTDVSDPRR